MVNPGDFKNKINVILSQDYEVEFIGREFDTIVLSLSERNSEKIYSWIKEVLEREIKPIIISSDKKYKDWKINELLTFRYPFTVGNIEYRILFVKVKNSIYIEFHLGDHKYYDKVRKELDLSK